MVSVAPCATVGAGTTRTLAADDDHGPRPVGGGVCVLGEPPPLCNDCSVLAASTTITVKITPKNINGRDQREPEAGAGGRWAARTGVADSDGTIRVCSSP